MRRRYILYKNLSDVVEDIPNNEIWYTSSNNSVIMVSSSYFNTNIVSNNYIDGKGIITFASDVTSMSGGFYANTYLTSIYLPKTLLTFSGKGFMSCTSLNAVYIDDLESWFKIDILGHAYCAPLWEGQHLYVKNKLIKYLKIPNSITSIKKSILANADSLKVIDFNNTTYIGEKALESCTYLESVIFKTQLPPSVYNNNIFTGASLLNVYVEDQYFNNYSTCSWLNSLAFKICPLSEFELTIKNGSVTTINKIKLNCQYYGQPVAPDSYQIDNIDIATINDDYELVFNNYGKITLEITYKGKTISKQFQYVPVAEVVDITDQIVIGVYYNTKVKQGNTVTLTTYSDSNYGCTVVDVSDYNLLEISGQGGASARFFCFLDSDNCVIDMANVYYYTELEQIVIPENAQKIIININKTKYYNVKLIKTQ